MKSPPVIDVIHQLQQLRAWFEAYVEEFPFVDRATKVLETLKTYTRDAQLFDRIPASARWPYWQTYAKAAHAAQLLYEKGEAQRPRVGRPPGSGHRQREAAMAARRVKRSPKRAATQTS